MSVTVDLLAAQPFFAGVSHDELAGLAAATSSIEVAAGDFLARSGEAADHLYAVVSGRAGIEIAATGREPIVVATVHAGEIVGWSWFVAPFRWRFDVVAMDAVQALAVDAVALRAAFAADHELGYRLAQRLVTVMAARLDATRLQLVDVYGTPR